MNVLNSMLRSNQPAGQQQDNPNEIPWMISTAAKVVGSVAGVVSVFMGFLNLLSILEIKCIFVGAILIIEGFFLVLTEAPCCCMFLDFAYMPSTVMDKRSPWYKAVIYLMFAIIPFFWCVGFTIILSCGLIMATSAFYVLMAMGRKANRDEMRVNSSATTNGSKSSGPITTAPTAVLVQNEELPVPSLKPGSNQVIY